MLALKLGVYMCSNNNDLNVIINTTIISHRQAIEGIEPSFDTWVKLVIFYIIRVIIMQNVLLDRSLDVQSQKKLYLSVFIRTQKCIITAHAILHYISWMLRNKLTKYTSYITTGEVIWRLAASLWIEGSDPKSPRGGRRSLSTQC